MTGRACKARSYAVSTAGKHLLDIDEDAVLLAFNEADLSPVHPVHPKRLLRVLR